VSLLALAERPLRGAVLCFALLQSELVKQSSPGEHTLHTDVGSEVSGFRPGFFAVVLFSVGLSSLSLRFLPLSSVASAFASVVLLWSRLSEFPAAVSGAGFGAGGGGAERGSGRSPNSS